MIEIRILDVDDESGIREIVDMSPGLNLKIEHCVAMDAQDVIAKSLDPPALATEAEDQLRTAGRI